MKSFLTNLKATMNEYFGLVSFSSVFIIIVAGWLGLLVPKYQSLQETTAQEYAESSDVLHKKEAYLEELKGLEMTYNSLNQSALQKLEGSLPQQDGLPSLFTQLESIVASQNLEIINLDASEASAVSQANIGESVNKDQGIKHINFTLQVKGIKTYEDLRAFLTSIEESVRIIDVQALQYQPQGEAYAFNMRAYYLQNK